MQQAVADAREQGHQTYLGQSLRAADGQASGILFALWLYATLDGVGSAREGARLTDAHGA